MNGVWCQLQHCDFGSESPTPREMARFLSKLDIGKVGLIEAHVVSSISEVVVS